MQTAAPHGGDAPPVVKSFSHVGITVSDFGRSAAFYADTFGCTLLGAVDIPAPRLSAFYGINGSGATGRMGWLRLPDGAILELFAFTPSESRGPFAWNRGGVTHVALNVDSAARWHQHLTSRGVECLSEPERMPMGQRVFFAADPDGNVLELIDSGVDAPA